MCFVYINVSEHSRGDYEGSFNLGCDAAKKEAFSLLDPTSDLLHVSLNGSERFTRSLDLAL
jgi:hypothetical protein